MSKIVTMPQCQPYILGYGNFKEYPYIGDPGYSEWAASYIHFFRIPRVNGLGSGL